MPSDFDTLFAACADPILDDHFGEAFTIVPQAAPAGDVNARKVNDAGRAGIAFTGVWSAPHGEYFPESRSGHAQNLASRFGDDRPTVDYVTASLAYRCRIGDVIVRVATGQRYTVADIDSDDVSRTTLHLTSAAGTT